MKKDLNVESCLLDPHTTNDGALDLRQKTNEISAVVVGRLVGFDSAGAPLVTMDSGGLGPILPASSCVSLRLQDVGREVVLMLSTTDPQQRLLIGVVQSMTRDTLIESSDTEPRKRQDLEFEIEGKTIVISAAESLTMRCGDSSITLTRDGKVVIRGIHVVSHAAGVNRIRGGAVQLN
jgi:uncharacterized protein DUF6484